MLFLIVGHISFGGNELQVHLALSMLLLCALCLDRCELLLQMAQFGARVLHLALEIVRLPLLRDQLLTEGLIGLLLATETTLPLVIPLLRALQLGQELSEGDGLLLH